MKLLDTDDVEDAGEALADEHVGFAAIGGVAIVYLAGLDGADVDKSLMPLLFLFTVVIGDGEGDRLLLLPRDEVEDADEGILSTFWL